jgi:hypothetical protein
MIEKYAPGAKKAVAKHEWVRVMLARYQVSTEIVSRMLWAPFCIVASCFSFRGGSQ